MKGYIDGVMLLDMGVDPDDEPARAECRKCEALLPEKPAGFEKVRDEILTWDEKNGCPLEWSWIDEPYWRCSECGETYSLGELPL